MRILLLGGSKFMGLTLVQNLIEKQSEYSNEKEKISIYITNRGRIYWNGLFKKLIEGNVNVHHFISDRTNLKQFETCLDDINTFINNSENFKPSDSKLILFDYILDFTCYRRKEVKFLLEKLNFSFNTYLLISTDSTYNASELALKRDYQYFLENKNDIPLIEEQEAEWCEDIQTRKLLKKRDDYGYNKLKCEIELKNIFESLNLKEKGKNYFILRLPDVIGTYDESYRLWYYIEWVKNCHIKPIEVEKIDLVRKMSLVEKDDVVDVILRIVFNRYENTLDCSKCANQVYNLGCIENITLLELIDFVSHRLEAKYEYEIIEQNALTYYPSITFGPISVKKAMNLLNFKPTDLKASLNNEFEFFEKHGKEFEKEYKNMIKDLPKEIKNHIWNNNKINSLN